ncbi:MAG: zinc ABC transporter substrate-binding protein, partial [Muribaculaceae bacterium]|nr:zinc ABC transporter substrate-binding protein [Muribaculaceae bacterium]
QEFKEGCKNLISKLEAMNDSISDMNLRDKSVVIRHPSLSYFARDYGIRQIALQEDGKETSPLQFKRRLETVKDLNATVFISEREHSSSSDKDVASQLGINLIQVSLNSSDWLDDLMRVSNEINRD